MKSNIQLLRAERQITQVQLAEELDVSQQVISRMENDRNKIAVKYLIALADYFQVSTDAVLGYQPQHTDTPGAIFRTNVGKNFAACYDDKFQTVLYEVLVGIREYLRKAEDKM